MRSNLLVFLFLFSFIRAEFRSADAFVAEATEIIGVVRLGVSLVEYIYKVFSHVFEDSGLSDADLTGEKGRELDRKLLVEYNVISAALDRLGQSNEEVEKTIRGLRQSLPNIVRRELKLDRVDAVIRSINNDYRAFEYYQEHNTEIERHTLEDFAQSSTSHGDGSIRSNLEELHSLIVPEGGVLGDKGILHLLANGIQNNEHLCEMGQSPHQLMFNLYNILALTEIKGYAMIQFSYMMLKLYNKGNFTLEEDLARRSFESQATEKLLAVKGILPNMNREFWRCDPKQHQEGKTFVRMTELLQGIIENEVDLNNRASCKDKCSSYTVAETHGCFKNLFCAKQNRCKGRLFDCQFYDADAWVCMSNERGRRYDHIEYEDGTILGNKNGQCVNNIKVDSWWRWLIYHCSYCLCKCDQSGPDSDRYWSLKAATADITQNKVVTGVRFVKKDRIIHLEIQQAVAVAEGGVQDDTREWKEAESLDVETAKPNEDIMVMSYEQRAFDTDRLQAPPGHVITGVKLRNIGGHINLEVQVTPIKFTDGKLLADRSTWIGNDATPVTEDRRREVHILMPDIPTNYHSYSEIDSEHNQYIQFDASSAQKDVMQTTIPYIDSQEVTTSTGTWLSGIGLYHKGHIGFGGFVGVMIKTFDFSRHLLPEKSSRMTKEALRYDFDRVRKLNNSDRKKKAIIRK